MKNSYINAMNKISASDDWRAKTLAAMNAKPINKTIRFNQKWAIVAACVVFVICIPTAFDLLSLYNGFSTKSAASSPQAAPQMQMSGAEDNTMKSQEAGIVADEEKATPRAMMSAVSDILTQADATALLNDGLAFIKGTNEAGGYEIEGLIINEVEFHQDTATYHFDVTDKHGNDLTLLVF